MPRALPIVAGFSHDVKTRRAAGRNVRPDRLTRSARSKLLHQLDNRQLRRIPRPNARLRNARITAGTILELRSNLLAKLLDDARIEQVGGDEATRVQIAAASLRDQSFGDFRDLFRFGRRGLDLLVQEERRGKVAEQRLAVSVGARKALVRDLVRHVLAVDCA